MSVYLNYSLFNVIPWGIDPTNLNIPPGIYSRKYGTSRLSQKCPRPFSFSGGTLSESVPPEWILFHPKNRVISKRSMQGAALGHFLTSRLKLGI